MPSNALRSPKRTAATAGALMIGVAVVSLFTVFGASLKATMDQTVSRSFAGDVAVSTPSFGAGGSGLSPSLAGALRRLPEVDTAVGLGLGVAEVDGRGRALTVTDPVALARTFDLGEVRGTLDGLGADGIALTGQEAGRLGLTTGDTTRLTFTDGEWEPFTVRAVYDRSELLRAVGQTRSQLRAMVRWESVLVAAFGTAGGLGLGAFLGWVLVKASDGASDSAFAFSVPPVRLAVVALVGLAAGALAGLRPAGRAARLDVLRAVATE